MPARVAVFIDGANVYRAFKTVFGDTSQRWLKVSTLSREVLGPLQRDVEQLIGRSLDQLICPQ